MDSITLVTAIAGLVFGFLGAVLGILNTWRAWSRDRVRLRVLPIFLKPADIPGYPIPEADITAIHVVNLSTFEVTITEVGFTLVGKDDRAGFLPGEISGCSLPQKLAPRACLTARLPLRTGKNPTWSAVDKAYVRTACGVFAYGTSDLLEAKKLQTGGTS